ncbi:hypothetical protein TraAM80_04734 [Trypanosoma rangeli]|uniref:Uncharacterized protein n=1 Tax=Trypanosoma rangeli TaxID=5698 RepID=A0A422NHY0_TRYRA|nr:uncharacterized protein TraAM80_04734 [Trypanosoma rangeli]RNF05088.1 hypothetical protein TraAM80_04734 [Trypanosoma rangeli]|eukprot:RNF05088.1 hypothetical protein TraAM80_04734 [Trypanosoma rangeli]
MATGEPTSAHSGAGGLGEHPERHAHARTHVSDIGESKRAVAFKELSRLWLTPFFGANEPEPQLPWNTKNPCQVFSRYVHECLEHHDNNVDFCQTRLALLQSCLNEFNM